MANYSKNYIRNISKFIYLSINAHIYIYIYIYIYMRVCVCVNGCVRMGVRVFVCACGYKPSINGIPSRDIRVI